METELSINAPCNLHSEGNLLISEKSVEINLLEKSDSKYQNELLIESNSINSTISNSGKDFY